MNLEPATQVLQLRCRACRAFFDGSVLTGVSVDVAIASMRDNRCPRCGAGFGKLSIGQARTLAEDRGCRRADAGAPLADRIADWDAGGERGTLAGSVRRRMTGARPQDEPAWDPSNLHRCLLLLDRIPEWERDIGLMADCSPQWAAISAAWTEIAAVCRDEAGPDLAAWPRPRTAAALGRALAGDA